MFTVYPEIMAQIDKRAMSAYGIQPIVLMENAGLSVTNYILANYKFKNVLVLAGPGNNGGDAFVVARHLFNKNYNVAVCITGNKNKYKNHALTNLKILQKLNVPIYSKKHFSYLIKKLTLNDIIVDGIFGTGFKGEIRKEYIGIFKKLNSVKQNIISVDIPSGINGQTGDIAKYAIKAHSTVTFQAIKVGMLWNKALEYTGNLIVADISIPQDAIRYFDHFYVLDEEIVRIFLKQNTNIKKQFHHKTSKGKLGIIGGNSGMQGAPQLSGISALKTASGIVYVHLLKETEKKYFPEIVFVNDYENILKKNKTIVIGPGMGTDENAKKILLHTLKRKNKEIIIDADAINILSEIPEDIRKELIKGKIITPHPEEFRRISGKKFDNIKEKIEYAIQFARQNEVLLVLKSPPTIITDGDMTFIFPSMSSKLATAGSGDILSGIIGSLISSGYTPFIASLIAVYVHFKSGFEAKGYSISGKDIINKISYTMEELLK